MTKICYKHKSFGSASLDIINQANEIIEEYQLQGFSLTLRQLYYQFVARGILPNTNAKYKQLGNIISDARLAGLIDWEAIEDRTRFVRSNPHWETPQDIVQACSEQFHYDLWESQPYRVEVWIEKDALVGVIEQVCRRNDVAYFSCRGYVSQSEMWESARRYRHYIANQRQNVIILHLGDHDPSGIDMTRDINDRLSLFLEEWSPYLVVTRIALTIDQVNKYNPPPNPTKFTDTRAGSYYDQFGHECWELDALDPVTLSNLIEASIHSVRDDKKWKVALRQQEIARKQLKAAAEKWDELDLGV